MSFSSSDEPAAPGLLSAITALRTAAENADGEALAGIVASDVIFHTPLTSRIRFEGREEVTALHRDIFAVIEGLSTTEPLTRGDTGVFTFSGHVRGLKLEAMNLVRVNDHGKIVEFTIFARPLPALATLFATLPPRVTARRRGRAKGALVAALATPLGLALRTADVLVPRLI
ncbi:nuclear transport factor 2 family protein [Mycolicibacterium komossense]|uniref:Nuclear transport factor 2 family protein n=1 Tax=Mycolicibacterium komossense TaxID=1779 RepID=A0ABT3C9W7_9MYCO|nr:nuclear transport factor 2 family protein [Mycolicibacterium komossense]MCV7226247.1 nuclear transport factor 2 family protein [Mycolicibacterium komossense]